MHSSAMNRGLRGSELLSLSPGYGASSALALAVILGWASVANAEEVSADAKAAARDLATQGISDANAGNCEAAVPKLERAERLYHAPTILTALGECQVRLGKLVEGSENLKRVTLERIDPGASPSFFEAQKKASTLLDQTLPRIAKLTVHVEPSEAKEPAATIDDVPVQSDLLGIARPTDPGQHVVRVSAEGYLPAETTVTLDEGEQEEVTLELSVDPNYKPPVPPAELAASANTPPAEALPKEPKSVSIQPTLGWIGIGVGAAALAAGGITGGMALSESNNLDCPNNVCSGAESDRLGRANDLALTSTILFGAGGVLAVTGLVLLLTSPSHSAETAALPTWTVSKVRLEPVLSLAGISLRGHY